MLLLLLEYAWYLKINFLLCSNGRKDLLCEVNNSQGYKYCNPYFILNGKEITISIS